MAEDNNLPPIKPLELMRDENITTVDFSDFIGVWDNFMPENVCNKFIDWYKDLKNTAAITQPQDDGGVGDGRFQFQDGNLGRYDKQILINHNNYDLQKCTVQYIRACVDHYIWKYRQLASQPLMSTVIKFQHTPQSGGYHTWHYEAMGLSYAHRVLTWMIYLNEDFEGGETEFLDQTRRVKPTTGTMLIWPAGFTHTHKGNLVLSGDKYILTGWYLLNGS